MRGTRTKSRGSELPETFQELNQQRPLRPIQDRMDFENAQELSDRLAVLDQRTKDQEDYLETLSTLMEKYEEEHSPIETKKLDPIETLRYLMEEQEMSASELGRVLGNRQLGAAVLRGDRTLSKANILRLSEHFRVGAGVFLKG